MRSMALKTKNGTKFIAFVGGLAPVFMGSAVAQEVADPTDKVFWQSVCGVNETDPLRLAIGGELQETCRLILNTPGSAAHSTASSTGNNLTISGGLARSTSSSDEARKQKIKERLKELKEKQENNQGAGDILDSERLGFFISGKTTQVDRKNTDIETGYDAETYGFVAGMDYQFSRDFAAGLAIGYANIDTEYDGGSGVQDTDSVSVMLYNHFSPMDNLSLNAYAAWTGYDYDSTRNITIDSSNIDPATVMILNGTARGNTDGDQLMAGIGASYDLNINSLTITPRFNFDYSDTWIQGYTETDNDGLALIYEDQAIHSYKTTSGIDLSYASSFSWGVLLPRAKIYHVHEFSDSSRIIHASFAQDNKGVAVDSVTESPDRDYLVFGVGFSAVLPHALQLFVDFEKIEEHRYINSYTVTGGLRMGF